MWNEQLPNGKFKFYERYIIESTGKEYKPSVTLLTNSPQSEKKAKKILDARFKAKSEEMHRPIEDLTFR